MTRARNRAEARLAQAKVPAHVRAAYDRDDRRVTRARLRADARAKAQRSLAAARLQVCANVFARSRIHFDATRWPLGLASATDHAQPRPGTPGGRDFCGAQRAAQARNDEFTIH